MDQPVIKTILLNTYSESLALNISINNIQILFPHDPNRTFHACKYWKAIRNQIYAQYSLISYHLQYLNMDVLIEATVIRFNHHFIEICSLLIK
jgi:hypothetical protein